jgi:hypothetical protein
MFCICGREIAPSLGALTNALMITLFLLHHVDSARFVFHCATLRNWKPSLSALPRTTGRYCIIIIIIIGWTVKESNPRGGKIFRTRPDRPWGPPSLLYNVYRIFPGLKRPGRGADHPPPPSAEVENEWGYTSTPPLGPWWPGIG